LGSSSTNVFTNSDTIKGSGNIGDGQPALTNTGVINATSAFGNELLFEPSSAGASNTGTLEASTGGTLNLAGNLNNSGGTINANGGAVELTSGILSAAGGTLEASNGGTLAFLGGTVTNTGSTIKAEAGLSYRWTEAR
jgi:filamentous hemagglutinin